MVDTASSHIPTLPTVGPHPCPSPSTCVLGAQMDRLVLELKLTPLEAFWHVQRVVERVNAISSSLITSEVFRLDKGETYGDALEKVK